MVDDSERRRKLETAGPERARQHLDIRTTVREYERFYRRLIT